MYKLDIKLHHIYVCMQLTPLLSWHLKWHVNYAIEIINIKLTYFEPIWQCSQWNTCIWKKFEQLRNYLTRRLPNQFNISPSQKLSHCLDNWPMQSIKNCGRGDIEKGGGGVGGGWRSLNKHEYLTSNGWAFRLFPVYFLESFLGTICTVT